MKIIMFKKEYRPYDSIANFMDFYDSFRLKCLASDLLKEGLSPKEISDAVKRAIHIGKSSGMDIGQHFRPVFSGIGREIINDCKLSNFAYALVLLNADVELSAVTDFQVSVLQRYLEP